MLGVVTMEKYGVKYYGLATANFLPDLIKPTTKDPADFDKFWVGGKAEVEKLPSAHSLQ